MEGGHEAIATTIDERVVEMRFDNRQFEDGVQTSLSTLDKLKRSLNLEGAARGLEAVDEAARSCRMTPLSNAVDSVKLKFSALEVIAVTALANITNSVINTGKQMIKSLTIDPIKDGFEEYELKMNSVQTIMNSSGESLETVTGYLDELNTYADKTIYSFSDMTSNIGKFTNAGVSLDKSVKAIQGVSNVAALSGANTQQASHAMYNFAQALSSGAVKLIDWKSIETANMATVDFKNELIKTALALGTVKKKGEKYITTTKDLRGKVSDAFDANSNFNESLSNQWLTSEVLIETLGRYSNETTEIGKKAFAAAQDVKTFSQLMDTLKEGVGSGWAQTWELIFGNFDEAKALWTEAYQFIGGFIDSMSNARNDILSDWNKLGGRAALLDSVRNTLKGIVSFIKPIKEGFKDIFPSITGKQLADFTEKIENLTSHFKIGDGTAEKIKNSFKGLFAVLDIGRQALLSLTGLSPLVKMLIGALGKFGQGALFVTNKIGLFATALDEFVKRHQIFKRAVDGIVSVIVNIPSAINSVFQKLTGTSVGEVLDKITHRLSDAYVAFSGAINSFKTVDTSGIDSVGDRIRKRLQPLSVLCEGFKKILQGIWAFFKKLSPVFAKLAASFGTALGSIGDAIGNAVTNTDFSGLIDIFNSGVLVAIGMGLKKLIDSLTEVSEHADSIVGGIKEVIGGVTDCLSTMQQNLKADILKKIAVAIGILTVSLVALSLIDSQKLTSALAALVGEFVALFGSMSVFESVMGEKGFNNLNKVAKVMVTVSAAILILSFAMKNLASLDWDGVAKGLVSVSVLSGVLLLVAERLSENSGKMIRGATGLLIFALAVGLMVKPVKELGALKLEEIAKGLGAVTVIIGQMITFTRLIGNPGSMISTALGMVLIGSSMLLFARAVERMGALPVKEIAKGLFTMSAALAAVTIAVQFLPATTPIIALGLILIGGALNLLALALAQMGKMSMAEVGKSLLLLAGSLTIIAVAVTLMVAALPGAAALVIISGAMVILAGALMILGKMSMAEVGKSLLALAGSLTIIAVAVTLMIAALPGAAALLVVAGALAILAPVLKILGGMSMSEIGKSLLMLAATFAILGVAGALLTPVIPTLLGLGGAILLIGVGTMACGAGVLALSAGLAALAVSGTAGIAALVLAIEALIGLIPQIVVKIGEGLVGMLVAIGNMSGDISKAFVQIMLAIIDALVQVIPPFVEAVLLFIDVALNALAEHTPSMVAAGIDIIVGLIEGLALGIEENKERIRTALSSLFHSLIDLALTILGIHSPSTVFSDMGVNIILGLINGLTNKASQLLEKIREIILGLLNAAKEKAIGFYERGKEFISKLISGISEKGSEVKTKVVSVISDAISGIKAKVSEFKQLGKDMMNGLKKGINEVKDNVISATKNVATGAVNKFKNMLGINSPSRVFTQMGEFMDQGLIRGITRYGDSVLTATKGVGKKAITGLSNTISRISDVIDSDIDTQPTIRPVLDLDDIQNGVKKFNKLMPQSGLYSAGTSFNLASHIAKGIGESKQSSNNHSTGGVTMYNTFTEANARDGMALLAMLNRELGGAAW